MQRFDVLVMAVPTTEAEVETSDGGTMVVDHNDLSTANVKHFEMTIAPIRSKRRDAPFRDETRTRRHPWTQCGRGGAA